MPLSWGACGELGVLKFFNQPTEEHQVKQTKRILATLILATSLGCAL